VSDSWETAKVSEVQAGDRVRFRGFEFTVARVDANFLGREQMVALIEDEPEQWRSYPGPVDGDIEVQRG